MPTSNVGRRDPPAHINRNLGNGCQFHRARCKQALIYTPMQYQRFASRGSSVFLGLSKAASRDAGSAVPDLRRLFQRHTAIGTPNVLGPAVAILSYSAPMQPEAHPYQCRPKEWLFTSVGVHFRHSGAQPLAVGRRRQPKHDEYVEISQLPISTARGIFQICDHI